MDTDDMLDYWFFWGFLFTLLVLLALSAGLALVVLIAEVVRHVHVRQRCLSLAVEKLLQSIPDVAYKQILDGDGGPSSEEEGKELRRSQSSCVICLAQYEAGERCSVLPGFGHVFHRGCVATWLHTTRTTCPLCRATIGADDAVARKGGAAEYMV